MLFLCFFGSNNFYSINLCRCRSNTFIGFGWSIIIFNWFYHLILFRCFCHYFVLGWRHCYTSLPIDGECKLSMIAKQHRHVIWYTKTTTKCYNEKRIIEEIPLVCSAQLNYCCLKITQYERIYENCVGEADFVYKLNWYCDGGGTNAEVEDDDDMWAGIKWNQCGDCRQPNLNVYDLKLN